MSDSVVTVNVGGSLYTTTRSTLCLYPDSMLGAMFKDTMPTTKDADGHYFIDRDGPIFKIILDFLRYNKLVLPPDFNQFDRLTADVDFYQIIPLEMAVQEYRALKKSHFQYTFHVKQWKDTLAGNMCYCTKISTHKNIVEQMGWNICWTPAKISIFTFDYRSVILREGDGWSKCFMHDIIYHNNAKLLTSDVSTEMINGDMKDMTTECWMMPYPLKWLPHVEATVTTTRL